jgi:CheY-like chemotaxis protein
MNPQDPIQESVALAGRRVLVVEDETIVSFLLEDMLEELGCGEVWHAGRIVDALDLLNRQRPDAAVLDVNLAGELSYPVASRLDTLAVPFVFATGYGAPGLPERWGGHLVIQKPFQLEALASAMRVLLERG